MAAIDAELTRITLEVFLLAFAAICVASVMARRRSTLAGVISGSAVAALLWVIILLVELRWFARW